MRQAVFIEPVDAWSFRDGRPFEVGEAFEARSLFPPFPWTVLGCLRTALLRELCGDPARYANPGRPGACPTCTSGPCAATPRVGPPGGAPPFEIGPPLLARRGAHGGVDVFYPTPRDLVVLDPPGAEADRATCALLAPLEDSPADAAHPLPALLPVGRRGPERVADPKAAFVDVARLGDALAGTARPWPRKSRSLVREHPAIESEPRIGIGIDSRTRTAGDGRFYVRDVVRLEDGAGLVVETSEELGLDGAMARLGGDGRLARISRVDPPSHPEPAEPVGARFKVYLASPAWFGWPDRGDWRPGWLGGGVEGVEPRSGVRVRLRGAAVGALVPAGGWDLARQEPRPIRWLVPGGVVYFFEADDRAGARAAARAIHGQYLADDERMARAGFGLAFAGRW
jgi:CRISPR type III-B/RAMP module-associated protein Cmr3